MAAELNVFSVHPIRRRSKRQEVVADSVSVLDDHSSKIERRTETTGRTPRDCTTISVGRVLAKDSIDQPKQRNCSKVLSKPTKDYGKSDCNNSYNKNVNEAGLKSKASNSDDPETCNSTGSRVSLKNLKDSNNNVSGEESVSKRISYVLLLGKF